LVEKTLPNYPPFGKRMLLDNGWFTALRRDDVELVTEQVASLDETGVATSSGAHHEADVVVLATGFEAQRLLAPMGIRGRGGVSVRDVWGEDNPSAYLGMTTPGFPNLFIMYGPNANLGHGGSYMFMAECQARYISKLLWAMESKELATVEVRREVHEAYNARVDRAHERMIWTHGGMDTWYRNGNGRVVTNSPWRIVDYWRMTHDPDLDDFRIEPIEPAGEASR
jgi:4-hydroxyacetophenone monooxygenase